jgi:hypothetical protein
MKKNTVSIAGRQKSPVARDKYFLRDLHQEIDLYDRKLAHLDSHAEFASESEREEARAKLIAKRATLEKTARELAAHGVEFREAELPRSFNATPVHETRA